MVGKRVVGKRGASHVVDCVDDDGDSDGEIKRKVLATIVKRRAAARKVATWQ